MKLYMHTKENYGDKKAGERIEAKVIYTPIGYRVTPFEYPGVPGGWALMPRAYITVGHLLMAAEKKGIFLDTKSCGIK